MIDSAQNRAKLVANLGKGIYAVQSVPVGTGKRFIVVCGAICAIDICRSHNAIHNSNGGIGRYVYTRISGINVWCSNTTWLKCTSDDVFFTPKGAGRYAARLNDCEMRKQ